MATSPFHRRRTATPRLAGWVAAATVTAAGVIAMGVTPAAATPEPCEPHLVTHSPDGSVGVERAVSITAQSLEQGVEGWGTVAWESAPGSTVTAVTITVRDGTITTITEEPSVGSAFDVLELRFCGTAEGGEVPPDEPDAKYPPKSGQEGADQKPQAEKKPAPTTRSTPSGETRPTSDVTGGASTNSNTSDSVDRRGSSAPMTAGDAIDRAVTDSAAVDGSGANDPADADDGTATGGDEDATGGVAADDASDSTTAPRSSNDEGVAHAGEPEVLGVQLSSDTEGSTGTTIVLGIVLALILAGTGGTMWYRRSLR